MKKNVDDITKDDFREALETILNGKVTTVAPLGFSGDSLYLYNNPTPRENGEGNISWSGCVTMRTWCDIPVLLIGNKEGIWLCCLKINRVMGFDYILNEFHRAFENVKHLIDRHDKHEHEVEFHDDVKVSEGFKILELARSAAESTESA